jgi:3-deoxy-manno-octulosonate cytidylyltransferase (CMP-KDO synthetase)
MNLKTTIVIPARYSSSRLPGKPLILLAGKSMIQRVYERAKAIPDVDDVIIATDDKRIADAVKNFNGKFFITPENLNSGSERVGYVAKNLQSDIIVNLQGDEPLISPKSVSAAINEIKKNKDVPIATIACPINAENVWKNPSVVKVVINIESNAVYFSRSPIPYLQSQSFHQSNNFLRHIGVYIFRKFFLLQFLEWQQTPLEKYEQLEQLRILERGFKIKVIISKECSPGIDTPEDIEIVEKIIKERGY